MRTHNLNLLCVMRVCSDGILCDIPFCSFPIYLGQCTGKAVCSLLQMGIQLSALWGTELPFMT